MKRPAHGPAAGPAGERPNDDRATAAPSARVDGGPRLPLALLLSTPARYAMRMCPAEALLREAGAFDGRCRLRAYDQIPLAPPTSRRVLARHMFCFMSRDLGPAATRFYRDECSPEPLPGVGAEQSPRWTPCRPLTDSGRRRRPGVPIAVVGGRWLTTRSHAAIERSGGGRRRRHEGATDPPR